MTGTATFSDCNQFRYTLTRTWDESLPWCAFVCLNPSTATAELDDPTIRRCIGFAKSWGYGNLLILNIYAYRATNPNDMWYANERGINITGGPQNSVRALRGYAARCERVVAAWGTHGASIGVSVSKQWPGLECLGLNKDGSPKHPLYLRSDLKPFPLER